MKKAMIKLGMGLLVFAVITGLLLIPGVNQQAKDWQSSSNPILSTLGKVLYVGPESAFAEYGLTPDYLVDGEDDQEQINFAFGNM